MMEIGELLPREPRLRTSTIYWPTKFSQTEFYYTNYSSFRRIESRRRNEFDVCEQDGWMYPENLDTAHG